MNHLHYYKRKIERRVPEKDRNIVILDNVILFISVVAPFANLVQVYKIFSMQSANGVSVLAFTIFAILNIPWVFYGIVHKEKPLIITFTLWFFTNSLVVLGAMMYS
ncbi:MAG TPA: PQ-loop domain-containing transporter [Candidatus Nanoarchaeia archaeon]|nr:PQ-loop domain-containing transporter [Candidatus Nanoarchaeia archaeon]